MFSFFFFFLVNLQNQLTQHKYRQLAKPTKWKLPVGQARNKTLPQIAVEVNDVSKLLIKNKLIHTEQ